MKPSLFLIIALAFTLSCSGIKPKPSTDLSDNPVFKTEVPPPVPTFAGTEIIRKLNEAGTSDYLLGPGDIMDISVWRRPEVSRESIVIAPDGTISVPRVGVLDVEGFTIAAATEKITTLLKRNYEHPEVTLTVKSFNNNKAFVLGRVSKPGVVHFPGEGTLLEALALAGGLPFIGKETFLTRCAIIRGNSTVLWIDLRELLDRGNMALNARIINNDVIFIPEAEDEMVLVMGEVTKPGAYPLKRGLQLIDVVARAGGFSHKASLRNIYVIRPNGAKADIIQVNLEEVLEKGLMDRNFALRNDDIVYVSPTGIQKFNYALEQILPSLRVLSISTGIGDNLGLIDRTLRLNDKEATDASKDQ